MAFLQLNCRVQIVVSQDRKLSNVTIAENTSFTFSEVEEIKTSESTANLTDTCEISIPTGLQFKYSAITGEAVKLSPSVLFQIGDYVKAEIWYTLPQTNTFNVAEAIEVNSSKDYKATFTGYISDIVSGSSIVIKCENEMWALKQNSRLFPDDFLHGRKLNGTEVPINSIVITRGALDTTYGYDLGQLTSYNHENTSLEEILKCFTIGVNLPVIEQLVYQSTKAASIKLPNYRSEGARNLVQIFDDLREYVNIYAYWRQGTLYIGPEAWEEYQKTYDFIFGENIIDSSDLIYQHEDSIKYRVEIINIDKSLKQVKLKNGSKDYFGDEGGTVRKVFVNGFDTTKKDANDQLKAIADVELKKWKYTGYSGSYTTFGAPVVYKGDLVRLFDPKVGYLEGNNPTSYLVKGVDRTFSVSNSTSRQKITLSRKIESVS